MIKKFILKLYTKLFREFVKIRVILSKYEYGLNNSKREVPIIVSLTTFPARFDYIDLCLKSILLQKIKPDKIIVWIGSDTNEHDMMKLEKYKKYGIEFIIDKKHNYKSHKKYIYAFEKYSDSIIITLDDDLIYPSNIISSLVKTYKKYPNCIVARRVHKITWNGKKIEPYTKWIGEYKREKLPSHELFLTTGAGTLFPPNCFPSEVIDFRLIEKYAPTADDVWINLMAIKNDIKIVWAKNNLPLPSSIIDSQKDTLSKINVTENRNDEYIQNIMKDFNLNKSDFIK